MNNAYIEFGKAAMDELVKAGVVKAYTGEVSIANNDIKSYDLEYIADPVIKAQGTSYTLNAETFGIDENNRAKVVDMLTGDGVNDHSNLFKDLDNSLNTSRVIHVSHY